MILKKRTQNFPSILTSLCKKFSEPYRILSFWKHFFMYLSLLPFKMHINVVIGINLLLFNFLRILSTDIHTHIHKFPNKKFFSLHFFSGYNYELLYFMIAC